MALSLRARIRQGPTPSRSGPLSSRTQDHPPRRRARIQRLQSHPRRLHVFRYDRACIRICLLRTGYHLHLRLLAHPDTAAQRATLGMRLRIRYDHSFLLGLHTPSIRVHAHTYISCDHRVQHPDIHPRQHQCEIPRTLPRRYGRLLRHARDSLLVQHESRGPPPSRRGHSVASRLR